VLEGCDYKKTKGVLELGGGGRRESEELIQRGGGGSGTREILQNEAVEGTTILLKVSSRTGVSNAGHGKDRRITDSGSYGAHRYRLCTYDNVHVGYKKGQRGDRSERDGRAFLMGRAGDCSHVT